jgi:hypothetical protein
MGFININTSHYDLMSLFENNDLVEACLLEPDKNIQTELKKQLELKIITSSSICLSRFFVFGNSHLIDTTIISYTYFILKIYNTN